MKELTVLEFLLPKIMIDDLNKVKGLRFFVRQPTSLAFAIFILSVEPVKTT